MAFDPKMHHRYSIRLQGYDYSQEGMYYVTLVMKDRTCALGEVVGVEVKLSKIGQIVKECWQQIPGHFPGAILDSYVIMPNHVHGILILKDSLVGTRHAGDKDKNNTRKDVQLNVPTENNMSNISPHRGTVSVIVRTFKGAVTTLCRERGFGGFGWHPRFYDHIIRDGKDLDRIRRYILDNPANWANDENYPGNIRMDRLHEGETNWSPLD